jgi:2-polyprenyl-6-methoxyphenol hydroxylase-like FAD-dependent oxidoreductase
MQDKQTDLVVDSDVAVVGAGPVGLIIAILLANRGHQVALIDRWPEPYALPRATGITHEILRCLQVAKVIDDVRPDILFTEDGSRRFEMRTGAGEVLTVRVDQPTSASGWPERASFSQPRFERTVNERARAHPNIRMLRGWNVIATSEDGSRAIVDAVASTPGDPGVL